MDGALRAYSNRSLVLAGIMSLVALIAVAGFLFVRMEPPTVIRIGSDGQASVLTPIRRCQAAQPAVDSHRKIPGGCPRRLREAGLCKDLSVPLPDLRSAYALAELG